MDSFFIVEPEVAGGLGPRTQWDRLKKAPLNVRFLHYEFDGWLGDGLLESTPCFISSEELMLKIVKERLTGVEFDDAEISTSDQFRELHPELTLPIFLRLKPTGQQRSDDFALAADLQLVVSKRALEVISQSIIHAVVTPLE